MLICAVERGKEVFIPNGSFQLAAGGPDQHCGPAPGRLPCFSAESARPPHRSGRLCFWVGGRIAYYLAAQMADFGADVKIIEQDYAVCRNLAEALPNVTVIHGDGTDHLLLSQEGIEEMDAVATLTGLDEQNILMSLYAGQVSKAKIITKITRDSFEDIVENMDVGSVFYPRYIAAEAVVRYVRAMANSTGSNVETLYSIVGDKAEALEFRVSQGSRVSGIPPAGPAHPSGDSHWLHSPGSSSVHSPGPGYHRRGRLCGGGYHVAKSERLGRYFGAAQVKTGKLQEMTGNFSEIVTGCPRASGAAAGRAAKIHKIPGSGKGFL